MVPSVWLGGQNQLGKAPTIVLCALGHTMMHISLLMQFINWNLTNPESCHPRWALWYPEQEAEGKVIDRLGISALLKCLTIFATGSRK